MQVTYILNRIITGIRLLTGVLKSMQMQPLAGWRHLLLLENVGKVKFV